jgi:hypothetical protein
MFPFIRFMDNKTSVLNRIYLENKKIPVVLRIDVGATCKQIMSCY